LEQLGFIRLIDRYVLDKALDELAAHPGVHLGFNISGLTAADRPWLRALTSQLRNRPEIASRVVIEITETASIDNVDDAIDSAEGLRALGVELALDDFGSRSTTFDWLRCRSAGFWEAAVDAGEEVKEGQLLGRVTTLHGEVGDEIHAPRDGVVLFLTTSAAVSDDGLLLGLGAKLAPVVRLTG